MHIHFSLLFYLCLRKGEMLAKSSLSLCLVLFCCFLKIKSSVADLGIVSSLQSPSTIKCYRQSNGEEKPVEENCTADVTFCIHTFKVESGDPVEKGCDVENTCTSLKKEGKLTSNNNRCTTTTDGEKRCCCNEDLCNDRLGLTLRCYKGAKERKMCPANVKYCKAVFNAANGKLMTNDSSGEPLWGCDSDAECPSLKHEKKLDRHNGCQKSTDNGNKVCCCSTDFCNDRRKCYKGNKEIKICEEHVKFCRNVVNVSTGMLMISGRTKQPWRGCDSGICQALKNEKKLMMDYGCSNSGEIKWCCCNTDLCNDRRLGRNREENWSGVEVSSSGKIEAVAVRIGVMLVVGWIFF